MITQSIALYNYSNGIIMMIVFGLVCLALVGFLVRFMLSGDKKKDDYHE